MAAVRTVKYFVQKCIFYITENFVVHIWNFLILEVYILDIIRHSILRDGSGPRRLNRHSQEILILYICKYFRNVSVMWKCGYCVYWYKVCVLPGCEAFYHYPAPHLDACNGHPVPAEPASTWAVLLCILVKNVMPALFIETYTQSEYAYTNWQNPQTTNNFYSSSDCATRNIK